MASKPREKMPISERAKQFMPFAALKGLPEALEKKEKELSKTQTGYDNDYGAWRDISTQFDSCNRIRPGQEEK